jgi:hypothetical protein
MSAPTLKLVSSAAADGLPSVTDAKSGMAAVLHILMKHMADCLHLVLDSVVEKYGLDKEEVMRVITESPRWKEMPVNPIINDLGYILPGSELAEAAPEAVLAEPQETAAAAPPVQENICPEIEDTANLLKEIDEVLAAPAAPATPQKKRVRTVKKVAAAAAVAEAPAVTEAPKEETPAPTPEPPKEEPATATPTETTPAAPPAAPKKKIVVKRVKKSELGATAALSTSE